MQMQRAKFTDAFRDAAVRQVIDRGHSVADVAKRLGIREGLLHKWVKKFKDANEPVAIEDLKSMQIEINRLKAELRRTTEERDILKKATAYFAKQPECVWHVSGSQCSPQWLLRMVARAAVAKG
jgi:transposase